MDDSLTNWVVGGVASLFLAGATMAVKLFAESVKSALSDLKADQLAQHAEVVGKLESVSDSIGRHNSQLAVLERDVGQLQGELRDTRHRVDSLAEYWQQRWTGAKP